MNLQANKNINFFLDNVVGGGQQEYSSGSVAFIRVYDTALSSADIPVVPVIPSVPEPESMAMMFTGLGLTLLALRRKSPPS